jgi:hypothetical protein
MGWRKRLDGKKHEESDREKKEFYNINFYLRIIIFVLGSRLNQDTQAG